jgi:tRNA A-37 threonylcarbamoyl transferase component Bud32
MELRQVGKYTIVEKIGAGAMGEVFRAHDPVLGRDVAIKVVLGKLSDDEKARKRFQDEARAAAQLNHPNIITVYDFGDERGMAYMAMELLEGSDLRQLLSAGKPMALDEKLAMMEQILDGLAFAHTKGVLHRDLKPGNIHVLPSGQIKIMDFGLARRVQDAAASGVVMGTPYYMAPEQAHGDRANARSDIFSLGAMFYELLSGRRPFTGATVPAVLFAVVHRDPEPLGKLMPELPTGIVALVMRALSKKPEARHAHATEMLNALRVAWLGGEVAEAEAAFAADDPTPAKDLGPAPSELQETGPELRAALEEIEMYLADRVPPLMVADSVEILTGAAESAAAAQILAWSERARGSQQDAPLVDLLYHALHKLSVIGELELVDNKKLLAFLNGTGAMLAAACPPGLERDRFRRALTRLGEAEMVKSGPVEPAKPQAAAPPPPATNTPGLRRLSMLEQRLRRDALLGPGAALARRRVASQAITAAATEAKSEKDLESHLRRLKEAGVASAAEHVFRSLGEELGDWALPKDLAADTSELAPPPEVRAMRQIVALAEDPVEVARRYRHLVNAATEQFNEGNLGRAVQMFELAQKLASMKQIAPGFLEPVRKKGHEALDPARLRQYMERPERQQQLSDVMYFFREGLSAESLLDQLVAEERRDRRRLQLDMLVVHGEKARALARARLETAPDATSDFARRNWIYLLRLIPRPAGEEADSEIDAVARCGMPGRPGFLVKEALNFLAQTRHPAVSEALAALLAEWEKELEKNDIDAAAEEEGLAALDRIAAGLARQGGPAGWRVLVRHGLSKREELGDTMARLAELGSQSLSPGPDVVETLMSLVNEGLPKGMLSRLVARQDPSAPSLIAALAGTDTPDVRAMLEDVAKRFAGQPAGRAAERALENDLVPSGAHGGTAPQHSGELDGYSLPALLYRFAQEKATGTLSLLPREGAGAPATIDFAQGRLTDARFGHRTGADAFYQLFERPFPGEFAFEAAQAAADGRAALGELGALVREGLRRYQQVAAASALVPDDVPLEATGESPATVEDEGEYDLVVRIWNKACARTTLRQLEGELAADRYRILRPLAQWVEQGALRLSGPAAAPQSPAAAAPGA